MRRYFLKNCAKRWDMRRVHWVTEWQKRGAPHLHLAIWFCGDAEQADAKPDGQMECIPEAYQLLNLWLKIAKDCGAGIKGQDVKPISLTDQQHWLQYQAKHGVRGVSNYQRSPENIPKSIPNFIPTNNKDIE